MVLDNGNASSHKIIHSDDTFNTYPLRAVIKLELQLKIASSG